MKDAAQYLIELQKSSRDMEALLAFASPAPETKEQIKQLAVRIGFLSAMIYSCYEEPDTKPPLKKAPDACGC